MAKPELYYESSLAGMVGVSTEYANLGDMCYRYDLQAVFQLTATPPTNAGSWTLLSTGGSGGGNSLSGTLTTSAATSDTVSIAGLTSSSKVSFTATNSAAATMAATGQMYVSSVSAGSVTITHPATAGATFNLIATPS